MKHLSTNEIRKMWLDFFSEKGHHIEPSKSLVPVNDKSLLFINSGVATLKKYFDGTEIPVSPKLTNSQKSIRTNDIENVGVTSRHHTLFEMLGNFSIGDYFKDESIEWGWELLTSEKWFNFEIDKLYITIHPNDTETYNKWISLGVDPSHIVKLEENFWEIGSGPGGPNTEIFYDRGESYDTRDIIELLEKDLENDRVIEIWNIVFSQYNCNPEIPQDQYEELPQKNIDTGMGVERMACVMQEVETNYETDNFQIIINKLVEKTGVAYDEAKMAYRVIADHVRALTFAIADGALPSNDGRGYVIRRILRRGVKYGYKDLNQKQPFMFELVDCVIEVMNDFYPYLEENKAFIKEVIEIEEQKFFNTLEEGIQIFEEEITKAKENTIQGAVAFKLYDTYGFPIELTEELAQEQNYQVDMDGFNQELEAQRTRAREALNAYGGMNAQNTFAKEITVASEFVGYDQNEVATRVVFITDMDSSLEKSSENNWVILDKTPFYAESGGQVGDTGTIGNVNVLNTVKLPNGQHAHQVDAELEVNAIVEAKIDEKRRNTITKNHTATHLLHLALHKHVGTHAKQAGSLQDEYKTRFDFSNLKAVDNDTLRAIEADVNAQINEKNPVEINEMSIEAAHEMGANSLFGEKYGDLVRVVKIGESMELCGGTHTKNSNDVEVFHIVSESGIGSGVRRIEAITAELVKEYAVKLINDIDGEIVNINKQMDNKKVPNTRAIEDLNKKLSNLIVSYNDGFETNVTAIKEILVRIENFKKELKNAGKEAAKNLANELLEQVEVRDGVNFIDVELDNVAIKDVRKMSDDVINRLESGVLIIKVNEAEKVSVIVKVSKDVADKQPANELLNAIIEPFNGRGGGKPTMAQGGYSK